MCHLQTTDMMMAKMQLGFFFFFLNNICLCEGDDRLLFIFIGATGFYCVELPLL